MARLVYEVADHCNWTVGHEPIEESLGQFERSNKLDSNERLIFFIVGKCGWVFTNY